MPLLHLTCINNDRGFFGALMGPIYGASVARVASGPNHIIFIENRPLREYFLLRKRKNALCPRFLGDRGLSSRSELFLQSIQLLPNPLMLIMGTSVESQWGLSVY